MYTVRSRHNGARLEQGLAPGRQGSAPVGKTPINTLSKLRSSGLTSVDQIGVHR